MKTRFAIALLIGAMLTACEGSSGASSGSSNKTDLTVFAASSLTEAFSKLGRVFQSEHPGTKVRFNFAASDTLATQITQGAPVDIFASAGPAPMQTVTSASLAASAPQLFASNRLVMVTPKGDPAGINRLRDLAGPGVKLVLAAPGVPAGDYARTMFGNLGLQARIERNVVSNEVDDKSVVSKILFGDAEAGIVYITDLTPDVRSKLRVVKIPSSQNVIAHYPIVVLKEAPEADAARGFVRLVLSAKGQGILRGLGFGPA